MELRVWDCPWCGAPLPPAGLDSEVTCTSCGKATTLADGSDAIMREQQSRAEAEALFARLGRPPRWSQRFATRLVDWRIWVFGFPFALGALWWPIIISIALLVWSLRGERVDARRALQAMLAAKPRSQAHPLPRQLPSRMRTSR